MSKVVRLHNSLDGGSAEVNLHGMWFSLLTCLVGCLGSYKLVHTYEGHFLVQVVPDIPTPALFDY